MEALRTELLTAIKESGFKKQFLAKKMGVTRLTFSRWLGQGFPATLRLSQLKQLADILGYSLEIKIVPKEALVHAGNPDSATRET